VVSVVIPVRNGAVTIGAQLRALSQQDYTGPWEIVVGDNGSTDRTRDVVEAWRERLPELRVVDGPVQPGVNGARNAAARAARGGLLLFADADDEVDPGWVTAMVEILAETGLACGVVEVVDESGRASGVLMADGPDVALGFLPFTIGASLGVRREVFDEVGGFDEDWPVLGSDDIDFCWRAQLAGAELGFSPKIRVRYRQSSRPRVVFAKQRGYGLGNVVLGRRFAAAGAVPWTWRYAVHNIAALGRDLPWLFTRARRRDWVKRAGWVSGVAEGLVRGSRLS
jgi:GT2 family glycosyltransferase